MIMRLDRVSARAAALAVAAISATCGCAQRHMPIDDLPVLDHSKSDSPPEQPAAKAELPRTSISLLDTDRRPLYGLGMPAQLGSWDVDLKPIQPIPVEPTQLSSQQRGQKPTLADHQQIEDDARALILENWQPRLTVVEWIHFASGCGIVSASLVDVATARLVLSLFDDFSRQGVGPTRQTDPELAVKRAANAGRDRARSRPELCARASPADRARMRDTVSRIASGGR